MWQRNSETWWRRTIATLLDVSFGTYMRRCRVVLMGRRGNVSLRCLVLVTHHWDVVGCFIWDLFDTPWRRTDGTLLLLPLEMSSRRSIKMTLSVSFRTYLRRHWDVQGGILMMSLWRLAVGWVSILQCLFICFDIYLSHYSLQFFQR